MNRVPVFFYMKWIAYTYCNHHISPLHMKIMMKIDIYKMKKKPPADKNRSSAHALKQSKIHIYELFQSKRYFFDCCFYFSSFYRFCLWYVIQFSSFPLLRLFFAILLFLCERERAIFFFFLIFNYFGQHNRIILCIFLRSSAQQHSLWFRLLGI